MNHDPLIIFLGGLSAKLLLPLLGYSFLIKKKKRKKKRGIIPIADQSLELFLIKGYV